MRSLAAAALAFMSTFWAIPSRGADGSDLVVEGSGLRNFKGHVVLYLWSGSGNTAPFPDQGKVQIRDEHNDETPCDMPIMTVCRRRIDSLQNLTVSYTFHAVPPGDYAVVAFHDENANDILDTGIFHRPLEARGYSQARPEDGSSLTDKSKIAQPRVTLNEPKTIVIGLRYPPRL